ncbi:GNAT family N-acetyltransferase [Pontibacter sp. SGAir0037]|uniref:GNAT family N-acetyltransferase n=1 Tax=Pontibacter sp. SGAir0037 TaxID=2571030 RepID=UPI0010CCD442|nr:GNAT family protein [Pontibacter sp. SGAir0037]QCR22946.1 N-acetyltransferase [Pontibacter sp. SGAir0037]
MIAAEEIKPVFLETERLYLRELNPEMYKRLFTSCTDEEIKDYMGLSSEEALQEKKKSFYQDYSTDLFNFKSFHLLDKLDGSVIGKCGYHTWVKANRSAEIEYELFCDNDKGKGLMKEALKAILIFGFEEMNLYRIEALIASYNIPSAKLLKYYGFSEEGNLRGHYMVDGILEDSLILSLLRPEYEELRSCWCLHA